MECASALTVEPHGFGERLGYDHLEAFLDEVADSVSVFLETAGGETLIGHVEEGEEIVLLHHLRDLVPLLRRRVNTRGVVSARVQQYDGAWLGVCEIADHSVEVESLGLRVIVSVVADLEARGLEDGRVVRPGGPAHVDGGLAELVQEVTNHLQRTGP